MLRSDAPRTTVRPGAMSSLLEDLSRAPAPSTGWECPAIRGEAIGRFQILREIGRGGFGVVYEAQDLQLPRRVALKAVRPSSAAMLRDADAVAEAEAAARLAHPNIVHLYDLGRCERGAFLVLELLRGETVRSRLERGPLPAREAVRIATAAARGVAHAHAAGIVHRDLTPANLFLCEDGQVKVLDFGLAAIFGARGTAGGTPGYMAPEQSKGAFDARSDVYALGVTLHELLTGKLPFQHGDEQGIARGDASPALPAVPSALARLICRMLARDRSDRPETAKEVLEALSSIERTLEPRRGARLAWGVAAAAAAAAIGIASRPSPAPLPPGRLAIAIADVANSTGDTALDGVSALLATTLQASTRLSVFDRGRLVEFARTDGRAAPAFVDEALAHEAARAMGAQAVFVPAVERLGDTYELKVRAVDAARNQPLFTLRERAAGRGDVWDAIDRLSDRIRKEVQESAQDMSHVVRVSKVVQSNPEAWRLLAQGRALAQDGRRTEAVAAFQRAVEIDPDFPLAHSELALVFEYTDPVKSREHIVAALRNLDRVPPKERAQVEAQTHLARDEADEAIAVIDRAIGAWPEDPLNHVIAADVFIWWWADGEGGRPYLEKALALSGIPAPKAIVYLLLLGRSEEALRRAERSAADSPSAGSLSQLSVVQRYRGDTDASLASARRADALRKRPPETATFWSFVEAGALEELRARWEEAGERSWELLAVQGRRREALAVIDKDAPPPTDRARRGSYLQLRRDYLWGDADPDLVWQSVSEELLLGHTPSQCAASLLASLGDLEHAYRIDALFGGLEKKLLCDRLYRNLRKWRTGDLDGAIRGLRGMWMPFATFSLGEVLADAGRHAEAVDAFRAFRRWPEWDDNFAGVTHAWPLSLYLEAVSLQKLGRSDEARASLDRLLRLWSRADPGLRPLIEAKALRAQLSTVISRDPAPSPSSRDAP